MAASIIAGNIDILTEILLRLPAKPLMKFKCVSKQWLTLISNPRFCHSHTLLRHKTSNPYPPSLLLVIEDLESEEESPTFLISSTSSHTAKVSNFSFLSVSSMLLNISDSCNGLLLVEAPYELPPKYFVCNPTTKQFVDVILPSSSFGEIRIARVLAFDPFKSSHFKIVSTHLRASSISGAMDGLQGNGKAEMLIKVYSSDTGRWVEFEGCENFHNSVILSSGTYWNSCINWYSNGEISCCFDVENQCFKTFPMPSGIREEGVKYFGESGGHLHMILESFENPAQLVFDVLEMKKDYSSWFMKFRVDLNPVKFSFPKLDFNLEDEVKSFEVLCFVCQAKDEDSMLVVSIDGRVMSCNVLDSTFGELCDFGAFLKSQGDAPDTYLRDVFQHFENLTWVGESTT